MGKGAGGIEAIGVLDGAAIGLEGCGGGVVKVRGRIARGDRVDEGKAGGTGTRGVGGVGGRDTGGTVGTGSHGDARGSATGDHGDGLREGDGDGDGGPGSQGAGGRGRGHTSDDGGNAREGIPGSEDKGAEVRGRDDELAGRVVDDGGDGTVERGVATGAGIEEGGPEVGCRCGYLVAGGRVLGECGARVGDFDGGVDGEGANGLAAGDSRGSDTEGVTERVEARHRWHVAKWVDGDIHCFRDGIRGKQEFGAVATGTHLSARIRVGTGGGRWREFDGTLNEGEGLPELVGGCDGHLGINTGGGNSRAIGTGDLGGGDEVPGTGAEAELVATGQTATAGCGGSDQSVICGGADGHSADGASVTSRNGPCHLDAGIGEAECDRCAGI